MLFAIYQILINKMNVQQLNCPQCKDQFTIQNPPRLLTMCGHTFCHKCIKNLITKRKQKNYRIKCPIDKNFMQMDKPNPAFFPKNIFLLNFVTKNGSICRSKQQVNQFLDLAASKSTIKCIQTQVQIKEESITINKDKQKCLLHNKQLQMYCVSDNQIICTDCALFGNHKNHKIKYMNQLIKQQKQVQQQFKSLIDRKNSLQKKLYDKQLSDQILDLFDNKKKIISEQITQNFCHLRDLITQKQKQLKSKLNRTIIITAQKSINQMKIQSHLLQTYKNWQFQVKNKIINQQITKDDQKISRKLKWMTQNNNFKQYLVQGNQIVQRFQNQEQFFINNLETQLNSIKFTNNMQKIRELIDAKFNIEDNISATNNQIKINNQDKKSLQKNYSKNATSPLKQNAFNFQNKTHEKHQDQQQSLLDFNTSFDQGRNVLVQSAVSCNNISVISVKSIVKGTKKKNMSMIYNKKSSLIKKSDSEIKLNQKKRVISINLSQLSDLPNKTLNTPSINKSRLARSKSVTRIQIDQKYVKLIEEIKQNKLETVDLSGAQLDNVQVIPILQAISQSETIKILKLMRNKLDDQFIENSFRLCLNVERLNLAQNKISQQSLHKIIEIMRRQKGKISYLNLGQNRIVERKNRLINQQFKKLGVNVVL